MIPTSEIFGNFSPFFLNFFSFLFFFFSISSVSLIQQSGPITHSSLCCIVQPRYPPFPNVSVCIQNPELPIISLPPPPPSHPTNHKSALLGCDLFLFCRQDHLCHILFVFFFCCFCFLGLHSRHMKVPRLGVESKLQLLACATATAMWESSHVCDLHHNSQQCWISDPLSKNGDQICILMDTGQICFCCHNGNSLCYISDSTSK